MTNPLIVTTAAPGIEADFCAAIDEIRRLAALLGIKRLHIWPNALILTAENGIEVDSIYPCHKKTTGDLLEELRETELGEKPKW